MKRFLGLVLLGLAAAGVGLVASASDQIRITAIAPTGPVSVGVPTEFTIEVDADLQSETEGAARIGFNVNSPDSFRMVESYDLRAGRQQITFKVVVTPVDWRERGDFAVMVNIGPKTTATRWTPTASVRKAIPVKP